MTDDEPDPQCPQCHVDLAHGDAHVVGCPMDLPSVDDARPIAEERMVLGAMLLSTEAVNLAATTLRADHFTKVGHRDLFEAILELWSRGDSVDPVSVSANIAGDRLIRVGGAFYVHSLMQNSPTSVNVAYYAELIRDRFRRAEIVHTLHRAIGIVQEGDHHQTPANLATIGEMLEAVLSDREVVDDEGVWLHEAIDDEVASWDEPEQEGLKAGFADFDDVVSGFRPGQMVIVAARPGIGKSALATDWCRYAAEHKASVLLFSLEMPRREVMQRLISAKAKVRLADIRANLASDHERYKMRLAAEALHETFFRIEDGGELSLAKLRTVARKMKRSRAGLDLLVVDYLQLMSSGRKVENRQQEVSEFSRGLKLLAKELGVPVVALSQLNRGPENRQDKKPMLSDLRESGSLEQDADIVVLISRPDAVERDDPRAGEADLILAKNRNGPTATIPIAHQLHYSRFADLARG